jgi:hypothetical protein
VVFWVAQPILLYLSPARASAGAFVKNLVEQLLDIIGKSAFLAGASVVILVVVILTGFI